MRLRARRAFLPPSPSRVPIAVSSASTICPSQLFEDSKVPLHKWVYEQIQQSAGDASASKGR
jgi:hypothetical protein